LVFDAAGRLYGTTFGGGAHGSGTVFQLSPKSGGDWSEKTIHSFRFGSDDGRYPRSGLVIDASGNLYGTTPLGGTTNGGVVFEVTPQS